MGMNSTAVIILNWNGAGLLREFLPQVIAATDSAVADVIVADNGSTDSSVDLLRSDFPQVRLITTEPSPKRATTTTWCC